MQQHQYFKYSHAVIPSRECEIHNLPDGHTGFAVDWSKCKDSDKVKSASDLVKDVIEITFTNKNELVERHTLVDNQQVVEKMVPKEYRRRVYFAKQPMEVLERLLNGEPAKIRIHWPELFPTIRIIENAEGSTGIAPPFLCLITHKQQNN